MRVLGVDPGSNATGFGLIERSEGVIRHLRHGVIRPPKGVALEERLHYLHRELSEILRVDVPEVAVVERVFLASNPRSALVLGQARGALLASLGMAGVRVAELAARQVKKAVTGSGAADKSQMQAMVTRLLSLDETPATDAADALALALTYAQAGPLAELQIRGRRRNSRRAMTQFVLGRTR
ncbi:MAG TPA: crossover junction endodeoxyribonuclease RuvC [Myxococcales bacterium]|nr:crossover junction endodeoxyribonuclease RuvC [Myxococcales bacterium]HIK83893.1 crossover junction endodeoxyribonuclease RuvC [Myxococcales bacterium]